MDATIWSCGAVAHGFCLEALDQQLRLGLLLRRLHLRRRRRLRLLPPRAPRRRLARRRLLRLARRRLLRLVQRRCMHNE